VSFPGFVPAEKQRGGGVRGLRHLALAPEKVDPTASRGRRDFLRRAGSVLLLVAAGGGALGEVLRRGQEAALAAAIARGDPVPGVALGAVAGPAFPVVDPSFTHGIGARPEATPPPALYVVSSEVRSPRVDPAAWHLTIGGLVDTPLTLSYAELRSMTSVEQASTLTCIRTKLVVASLAPACGVAFACAHCWMRLAFLARLWPSF